MNKFRLIAGLSVLVVSMIFDHHLNVPDFLLRTLEGFAIGIMILAFIKNLQRQKPYNC